jgi:ABC-type phosphate transport system permease subunit
MKGFSAYAGGVALGFMMIPLIIRTTEEVLLLVPNGYREAALALGIPRWKIILQHRDQDRAQGNRHRRVARRGAHRG